MASKGNTTLSKGIPSIKDAFVIIVKTEWNSAIINKLEAGVKKVLKANNITSKTITVPGAFEIPFAVKQHYTYSEVLPDAYISLGTIIRGDTPHFDYVCKAVNWALRQIGKSRNVNLYHKALETAYEIREIDNKTARWLASDAIRELEKENIKKRFMS